MKLSRTLVSLFIISVGMMLPPNAANTAHAGPGGVVTIAPRDATLEDAMQAGQVTIQFQDTGHAAGNIGTLSITNKTDKPLNIHIPLGTILLPPDTSLQARMTITDTTVPIDPGKTATTPIQGACIDPTHPVPDSGQVSDGYQVVSAMDLTLKTLSNVHCAGCLTTAPNAEQIAMAAEALATCDCGCGGTPRPYCAHKNCVCAKTGVVSPEAAEQATAGCQCGCGGTPRPTCAYKDCQCAKTGVALPAAKLSQVATCQCGCGGTPRPACAHKDCVCAKTGAVSIASANEAVATCQCGCGGTPIPACAHRNCACAQTGAVNIAQVLEQAAACQCGCGGTPRPACAHKNCVCAQTGAVNTEAIAQAAAACQCGCGGTPIPACAHRNCVCAQTGAVNTEELAKATAGCDCGCGGTPRPYCAHKNCVCAKTGVVTNEEVAKAVATCQCGCGGTPRPACAHKDCICSKAATIASAPNAGDIMTSRLGPDMAALVAECPDIVKAGQALEDEGALHSDLGPKQGITVIQRALWTHMSQGTQNEQTKATIREDIENQLKAQGKTATPEQVQTVTDHLWEDVNLVLKRAKGESTGT